ncbi:MAG: hypothetical protein PVG89_10740 [Gammaproteobacteria bacterium]
MERRINNRTLRGVALPLQRMTTSIISIAILCGVGMFSSTIGYAESQTKPVITKYSAVARKSMDLGSRNLPKKVEFRFDGANAWLRENGDFGVDAEVKHRWLLCGTYEVGIRFGIGAPACANVSWIGETHYVSRRKQCNNAWMAHAGNGNDIDAANAFPEITCAQLLIKCTGKCK